MPGPRELAQKPKELVDSDAIATGEVKIEHLSPGLYGEIRMIKAHAHKGATSRQLTHHGIQLGSDLISKAVFNFQGNLVNEINKPGLKIQFGWGHIRGSGANASSEAVTFPEAFSKILCIIPGMLGTAASAVTDIEDLTGTTSVSVRAASPSKTGFTAYMTRQDDEDTMSNSTWFGYAWVAIGVK